MASVPIAMFTSTSLSRYDSVVARYTHGFIAVYLILLQLHAGCRAVRIGPTVFPGWRS